MLSGYGEHPEPTTTGESRPERQRCTVTVVHVRVYSKAKELGVTSRALLHYLATNGCPLPSASSNLTDEALDLIPEPRIMDVGRIIMFPPHPDHIAPWPPWPQLVTGYQASRIAGVAPATIRQWVKRGHLRPAELRGRTKTAVYHLDDVLAARLQTRQRRRDMVPVYRVPRMTFEDFDVVVTAREAAGYFNISESTIRSWASRSHLVAVGRRGRSPLYTVRSIQVLIRSRVRPDLELRKPPSRDYPDDDGYWDD